MPSLFEVLIEWPISYSADLRAAGLGGVSGVELAFKTLCPGGLSFTVCVLFLSVWWFCYAMHMEENRGYSIFFISAWLVLECLYCIDLRVLIFLSL